MEEIVIDGVKYRVGPNMTDSDTAALKAAFQRSNARMDSVTSETATLKGRAEAAEKLLATTAEKLKAAERYDATDTEILGTAARVMGPEYSAEGKTPAEVMRDCVAKAFPNVSLEGKSDDFVSGLFSAIPSGDGETSDAADPETPKMDETAPDANPVPPNTDPTRTDSLSRVNAGLSAKPAAAPRGPVNPSVSLRAEAVSRGRQPLAPRG